MIREPPYCTSCQSTSHSRENCMWWIMPGVLPTIRPPASFKMLPWKNAETLPSKKEAEPAKKDRGKGRAK